MRLHFARNEKTRIGKVCRQWRCSRGVPRNLKGGGGGAQFPVFTENNGEDQKKGLHVFRGPIYPPKSSEN